MAETFTTAELVIPGTYLRVRAEGLIGVGGISTGNVGIVGTATDGIDETHNVNDYETMRTLFGVYDEYDAGAGTLNLTRGAEVLFRNGARNVYARGVAAGANQAAFSAAFAELVKEDVNIIIAPELSTNDALSVLGPVLETAENSNKDIISVVGSDETAVTDIVAQVPANDRIIFTAPGIRAFDSAAAGGAGAEVELDGTYGAAAVAGLIATLTPESSPTNKVLPGVTRLTQRFAYGQVRQLVQNRVLTLEERRGVRVVRGLTSDDGAFQQVTTRRITDFAKAGIRQAGNAFIGKLNNQRVRKALQGAIDGFLTTMVVDEQLVGYSLSVTATRRDEIEGRAVVNVVIQPTFSIDFVAVTLVLE